MQSKKVFIATDTFVAFIDRAHPKHLHASALFRYFAQEKYFLYTSLFVINDTHKILSDIISPSLARDFLKALSLSTINVVYPDETDLKLVYKTILSYQTTELSFAEALMAVICHKRNIPQICTFEYLHQLFGLATFYLPI